MSNQFVAEIRIFAGNFAPTGWAFCNGQLLAISQNTALFSLLGTTYGGDGKSNFALPNLQGMAPLQAGQGPGLSLYDLGQTGGEQTVTLLATEMPAHKHTVRCSSQTPTDPIPPADSSPVNNTWAAGAGTRGQFFYAQGFGSQRVMNPLSFSLTGGSLPHNNMPPYLGLTFIIALQGVYPPRS